MGGIQGGDSIHTASFQVIMTAQTSATGATFVAFADQPANVLVVSNATGTTIEVRYSGAGSAFPVPNLTSYAFMAITNANQLSLRRLDVSNSQVTVSAQALQP